MAIDFFLNDNLILLIPGGEKKNAKYFTLFSIDYFFQAFALALHNWYSKNFYINYM